MLIVFFYQMGNRFVFLAKVGYNEATIYRFSSLFWPFIFEKKKFLKPSYLKRSHLFSYRRRLNFGEAPAFVFLFVFHQFRCDQWRYLDSWISIIKYSSSSWSCCIIEICFLEKDFQLHLNLQWQVRIMKM